MTRLGRLLSPRPRTIVGVMSGMSMDGLDLALVRFEGSFPDLRVELRAASSQPYPAGLRARLLAARTACDARETTLLNVAVARAFADAIEAFLRAESVERTDVDAVGSHGQTLVHIPPEAGQPGATLQLGPPSVIAELCGLPTVANFRVRDMALHGHGAPLIPILDHVLYRAPGSVRVLNNLGSISNVTVVHDSWEATSGFDTGPANMPLDHFARRVTGDSAAIDRDGQFSRQGRVHEGLLADLLALPYFDMRPPKSAGYDDFGPTLLDKLAARHPACSGVDLVRTGLEFTVETMAQAYHRYVLPGLSNLDSVLLTGGGARNTHLVERLRKRMPDLPIQVLHEQDQVLNDAKEAVGMALLAHLFLDGVAANQPAVTGASGPAVLGELAL